MSVCQFVSLPVGQLTSLLVYTLCLVSQFEQFAKIIIVQVGREEVIKSCIFYLGKSYDSVLLVFVRITRTFLEDELYLDAVEIVSLVIGYLLKFGYIGFYVLI